MSLFIIARKELKSLFLSPLAWAVLAVVQAICAYLFLGRVNDFLRYQSVLASAPRAPGVTGFVVSPLFATAAIILLMVVPLLTMRLLAEERRAGTLTLLLSAPVSMSEIVLGKFLGLLVFLLVIVAMVVAMPAFLSLGTAIDWGRLSAGALGLMLMLAAFASAGLFTSAMTREPVVAAVAAFGLLLLLWIINLGGEFGRSAAIASVLSYLSLVSHLHSLIKGEVVSTDIIYYVLMIALFLSLSIRRLDAERR